MYVYSCKPPFENFCSRNKGSMFLVGSLIIYSGRSLLATPKMFLDFFILIEIFGNFCHFFCILPPFRSLRFYGEKKMAPENCARASAQMSTALVHKQQVHGCASFQPILSAFQTPTYNLAKFLIPILNLSTENGHTVKDSFQFGEDTCQQDPTSSIGSLGVDSLFTNIFLDETIDISVNQLFENINSVEGFKKSELKQLICLATKESYFIFNGLFYKQIDSIAMDSPLGPFLANLFLSNHEKNWLNNCPQGFKPVFYRS